MSIFCLNIFILIILLVIATKYVICVKFLGNNMSVFSIEPVIDSQLRDIEEIRRLYDLFDVSIIDNLIFVYLLFYSLLENLCR